MGEVNGIKLFAHGGHLLNERHVVVALVVGALHELGIERFDLALHVFEVFEGLAGFLKDSAAVLGHQVLRQVGNDGVFGRADVAAGGLAHAGENFEQRGLTGTVFSHQGDAVFLVDLKRDVFEKCGSAKLDGEAINGYHEVES